MAFRATFRELMLHAAAREQLFCPAKQAAPRLAVVAAANHDEVAAAFVSELHNAPRRLGAGTAQLAVPGTPRRFLLRCVYHLFCEMFADVCV
jgi:hypothetical protein